MRHFYLGVVVLLTFSQPVFSQPKRPTDTALSKPKAVTVNQLKKVVTVAQPKKESPAEKEKDTSWLFRETDNLATLIGYVLVATATVLTFCQWRADQKWKQKEALMNRVTSFDSTPGVWNALLMLGTPDRHVPLWDKEKPEDKYERVTRREVATALLPHELLAITFSPKETAIRDSFDDFLKRLCHLEVYRESNLLSADEINSAIHYWAITIQKLMASTDPNDQALMRNLSLYIEYKGLKKVITLFSVFNIQLADKMVKYRAIAKQEVVNNKWHRLP
ncbi:hypothetical protein [Spirosoma agri]|uniref:DUF4760 domain-containing protein n=1 Tax=Spirosoma agri TaxID=1987381 RepID=A0A6M0IKD0_9BACT|nr:hypothetical protein [Spirosoma agri]NEU68750.1 hypothetical protein [Spirosoma agri]